MNMNDDKDWNEFWDDEADRDDDEQIDVGSDVDANNDETFDNAAEWNEDEHEELIAQDSILSRNARNINNNSNHARDSRCINGRSRGRTYELPTNNNNYHHVEEELRNEAFLASHVAWNNNVNDLVAQTPNQHNLTNQIDQITSQSSQINDPQVQRSTMNVSQRLHHQIPQMPLLTTLDQLHVRDREPSPFRMIPDIPNEPSFNEAAFLCQATPACSSPRPKVIRVDDLERQLMKTSIDQNVPSRMPNMVSGPQILNHPGNQSKRTSWSPFGGKDLFANDPQSKAQLDSQLLMSQNLMSRQLSLEQQQRILLQQHQIVHQQQQLQQMALAKQQQELVQQQKQQQQMAQQHQMDKQDAPRLLPQNALCFTVEELERQMIADRSNHLRETKPAEKSADLQQRLNKGQESSRQNNNRPVTHSNSHDRRNGEKFERSEKQQDRSNRDSRDRRDRRDHRDDRENRHYDSRKKPTIIPPQVQLGVIEKERRLHSLTTMHPDEFLQDIMPTSRTGFQFNRHSTVSSEKAAHDGVLTEKERSWLTRIQEKIQADYDDNVDQDYYYLLYFNRSSMTEGAAQKPSGPGVLDRRFIPRERLLYNTSD